MYLCKDYGSLGIEFFKVRRFLTKNNNRNDNKRHFRSFATDGGRFCILLIVIGLGTLLIKLVNKYAPEEVTSQKPVAAAQAAAQQVDATVKAVIDAVVAQITGGKGHTEKITKL